MGYRLSKISTRTGDGGTTGLGDGTRVSKDNTRIHALGEVDELNSVIGMLLCEDIPPTLREWLCSIQHDLFDLGGELCIPGYVSIEPAQINRLDEYLAELNAKLSPLENFILPGGSKAASWAHIARTVCRRAERAVVSLEADETLQTKTETVSPPPKQENTTPTTTLGQQYLNRLSDLLFVLARTLNHYAGQTDVLWQQTRNKENTK